MFVVLTVVRDLYPAICLPVPYHACLECACLAGYLSRRLYMTVHVLVYVTLGTIDNPNGLKRGGFHFGPGGLATAFVTNSSERSTSEIRTSSGGMVFNKIRHF